MADQAKQQAAYAFLREQARSGGTFTTNDLNQKMGWKGRERQARDESYLIDETTAVVRFIIPCLSSRTTHSGDFELNELESARAEVVKLEVQQIRSIFFELFVEALVPTIRGEKLIWMLETTPRGQRLYELDLVKPKPRGNWKGSNNVEGEDDDTGSDETADDDVA